MLPSKPEEIDTKFLLYPGHSRRRSGSSPAEVPFTSIKEAFEWAKQGFNKSLPTKVLIHGFGSDCSHIWIYEMRSALMAVEEVNIICVDWEKGAILPNYVKATANTRLVGKQLAMLLKGLVDNNVLSLRSTHLIGFSLGAHVAGFAGAELGNLSRITGLDPAGPLFESQDPRARLDQSDAGFVDVIHSNGENLILGGLGSYQPMGHVDFYPNGGRMQKGCSNLFVGAVSDIIWSSAVEGRSLCNHRRAYKFFTDSVSPRCHFPAFPCESYEDFLSGKCFPCTDERKEDEEMKLGESISRILVPHPVLSEPTGIQLLYTAYSGWLSSGLTQWRMDKITISDSFGKTSSICKKNLVLDSGVPITLPLYPGECNLPGSYHKEAQDRSHDPNPLNLPVNITSKVKNFIPTQVVRVGPEDLEKEYKKDRGSTNSIDWKSDDDNRVSDNEDIESSRAFNTKVVRSDKGENGLIKEIVEPILKPHSNKNARSHNPDKDKPEITEPILGPTTSRNFGAFRVEPAVKNDFLSRLTSSNKEISYNFYDLEEQPNEWIPSLPSVKPSEGKWKREDGSKSIKNDENPLEVIAMTVQFLPQRLAKMFEQAEKYARETILPLVSTYTPKFISDIITPREKPKYLPLLYEETTKSSTTTKIERHSLKRNLDNKKFDPPPVESSTKKLSTTPYTHIQKIKKKSEKVETTTQAIAETTVVSEVSRKARDDVHARKNILDMKLESINDDLVVATTKKSKAIYIDLPVFDTNPKIKYIPVSLQDSKS
ncbi:Lipase and/or Abhydrolase 6 domain containing protein [Asbolus verrucosus]|uniref:Lipase and/or Abhydrolase 6 domain containing protein n=1 Tax=Asbolus verrucosus TaxID=1661398 RepID=A0A482VXA3_ASBVE|nr:Lipase and/or Abhydrolase 6 domain containing protein [Asbolus verrucosus]